LNTHQHDVELLSLVADGRSAVRYLLTDMAVVKHRDVIDLYNRSGGIDLAFIADRERRRLCLKVDM